MDCVPGKNAGIVLFDEYLVNLDYKLSKGPRSEFTALFKNQESIVIYAKTEAH